MVSSGAEAFERLYPQSSQVLQQLVGGGNSQEDRTDALAAQTPGCRTEAAAIEKQASEQRSVVVKKFIRNNKYNKINRTKKKTPYN